MTKSSLKQRHHCVYALNYHLVLVTKYRRKCLTDAMLEVIEASARERCAARDGELLEVNGEAGHVHLLVSLPPNVALSEFVNVLKTNTARILRRDFRGELALVQRIGTLEPELLRSQRRRRVT
jgi:putative transposase